MRDKIETIEYRGKEINTYYDTDAQSPDDWGNDECFIVYDHRDFTVERKGYNPDDIFENLQNKKRLYDGYHVFPLYAYIHSGVSLSLGRNSYPFTCNWDTSFKGFVLVKRQKGWSWTPNKAEKIAQSVVDEWNDYLSGSVYGYNTDSGSCWGFYGDEGYKDMIEEAKAEIDYDILKGRKNHYEQLKTWIRNKVPFLYRKPLEFSV